jgi:type IV secretory pathway component VirB8
MRHTNKADMMWEMDRANARARRKAIIVGVCAVVFLLLMATLAVIV